MFAMFQADIMSCVGMSTGRVWYG